MKYLIHKYELKRGISHLPGGAFLMHVGIQHNQLYAWAAVPEHPYEKFQPVFNVFFTGDSVEYCGDFKGTFLLNDGHLVLHVFYQDKEFTA